MRPVRVVNIERKDATMVSIGRVVWCVFKRVARRDARELVSAEEFVVDM